MCGFPISWDVSGQGTFQVFFDADGTPTGVHVLGVTSGELSANGITLRTQQANNRTFDFGENTMVEMGIVSQYLLPGTGVVLMDRADWSGTSTRKPVRRSGTRSSRPGHTHLSMGLRRAVRGVDAVGEEGAKRRLFIGRRFDPLGLAW